MLLFSVLRCVRKCDWVASLTHLNPPRYIGSPKLREVMGAGDLPDTKGSESSWRLPSSPFLITLTLCQVLRVIGLKIDLVRLCGLACYTATDKVLTNQLSTSHLYIHNFYNSNLGLKWYLIAEFGENILWERSFIYFPSFEDKIGNFCFGIFGKSLR